MPTRPSSRNVDTQSKPRHGSLLPGLEEIVALVVAAALLGTFFFGLFVLGVRLR